MKISRKGLLICGFIGSVVGAFLIVSRGFASTTGTDQVTFMIPASCTLSSVSNTHTDTIVNNTYKELIGGTFTTITTFCNDAGGYVIYADGYSNNEEGNNNLIGDNGGSIPAGTATSGNNSAWSFKLAALDDTLSMNPLFVGNPATIPSAWVWVAKKTSGITSSTGSSITASYGAFVSSTQPAGTYRGQVKYVLFHPSSSPTPITFDRAFANNGKTKYKGYYKMQDMTAGICNSVNVFDENSEAELIDVRDDKVYWVAKLDDGNCWMTENLDLDLSSDPDYDPEDPDDTDGVVLTSEDTNLEEYGSHNYDSSHGYSRDSDMVIYWMPDRNTIATDDLDSNTWPDSAKYPYSYDAGFVAPDGEKNGHGFVGNYYNWPAAVASNDSSSIGSYDTAANSICPKGWRLPVAQGMITEIPTLLEGINYRVIDVTSLALSSYISGGYSRMVSSPLYFVDGGYVSGGAVVSTNSLYIGNRGNRGLYFNSSSIVQSGQRSYGGFIRCVAQ